MKELHTRVPSRTIGSTLNAYVYPTKIELMFGDMHIASMDRLAKGGLHIDFKHIIHSLRKKPNAFEDYKYKECMYPTLDFRKTYDQLKKKCNTEKANKTYIELLNLAKMYSVDEVSSGLKTLLRDRVIPTQKAILPYLIKVIDMPEVEILKPDLEKYDELLEASI